MVRVTCSSGYPSLSQPLVRLRWGFLIPLIALSLDGVFRGCFAVDFSPFLPFRWLVLPLSFSFVSLAQLQRSLRFPPSSDIALYYPMVQSGRGKVSRCSPSHSAFNSDHGEFTIFTPVFPWGYFTCLSGFFCFFFSIVPGLSRVVNNKPFLWVLGRVTCFWFIVVVCTSFREQQP